MAKDLPYFKFYCSEWNDGDITLEDFNIQGLFINTCSYYWSNECNLSKTKLFKKFKNNIKDIEYLIQEGFIKIENDCILINFLNEQLQERKLTSKKNSEAGKKSAEKRRLAKLKRDSNENPTTVENTLNENPTIKKRREEKREDNNIPPTKVEDGSIDFNKLLEFINISTGRKFRTINKTVKQKYKARLKDGYKKEDVLSAITNAIKTSYHKDNNFQYLTPEFFSRSETLDKYSITSEISTSEKVSIKEWQTNPWNND